MNRAGLPIHDSIIDDLDTETRARIRARVMAEATATRRARRWDALLIGSGALLILAAIAGLWLIGGAA